MLYSLWFRRYAPFEEFGFGFEGDKRSEATTDIKATARTTGGVAFGPGEVSGIVSSTSGTAFSGLGKTVEQFLGRHDSTIEAKVEISEKTVSVVRFMASTSGGNPMVPLAPKSDTFLDVVVQFGERFIALTGKVRGDKFPNAEVFVYDRAGHSVMLFHHETDGDRNFGPGSLFGSGSDTVFGSFSKRIPITTNGIFETAGG